MPSTSRCSRSTTATSRSIPTPAPVEVHAYRVVQDVGRAVNPRAIRHQIQGGVVQGLGYALHEEITLTPGGDIAQRGLESYRPTRARLPRGRVRPG
jgi:CO/xanthine dehydrogenase Mo-binding subunit